MVIYALLIIAATVLYVVAVYAALGDPRGALTWPSYALLGAAALPTAWLVLEPLLSPTRSNPMTSLWRTLWAPFLPALVLFVVGVVLVVFSDLPAQMAAAQQARHLLLRGLDVPPTMLLLALGPLVGLLAGMCAGLGLTVVVVLPVFAIVFPHAAMEANDYDTSAEAAPANTTAVRAMAVLVLIAFASPTLIILGRGGPVWMGVLGWALAVVGIGLVIWIKRIQRPDSDRQEQ